MDSFSTMFKQVYPLFGWIGSLVILLGIQISRAFYSGKAGERYSIRNHFISELGEVGVSKAAIAFNVGMIVGGVMFLPLMVGLGISMTTIWSKLGMVAGLVAALACVFVGIFPMSNLTPHRISAMLFFRSGLVTIILFTIAIFAEPAATRVIPLYVNVFSFLAILSYSSFLIIVGRKMDGNQNPNYILDPMHMPDRPQFWRSAFLEWMILFTTLLWFLIVATLK